VNTHVIIGGPWPQRIGCECHIVHRPVGQAGLRYPWNGLGASEVVISIEDDPLTSVGARYWSCVIDRTNITPIGAS
jgi:hypothetical protein